MNCSAEDAVELLIAKLALVAKDEDIEYEADVLLDANDELIEDWAKEDEVALEAKEELIEALANDEERDEFAFDAKEALNTKEAVSAVDAFTA